MDYREIRNYAEDCFRDAPPPCSRKCPFGLDVRSFIGKARDGRAGGAFRLYRDATLFPGVVSALCPADCATACVRNFHDRSVDLKRIERAVVDAADRKESPLYALPEKNERIAVVGAGVGGLACAFRLASKGYHVDLYERTGEIGGRVRSRLPVETYEADFAEGLRYPNLKLRPGEKIRSIDRIRSQSDAVYIAVGAGGGDFGLSDGRDDASLATSVRGVFAGGGIYEADDVRRIENGLRAASSVENYLRTGKMKGREGARAETGTDRRYYLMDYDFASPERNRDGDAMDEAARCFACDCSLCVDACQLMRHFRKAPKRVAADLSITIMPIDEKTKRIGSRMLNSCNLCGLCTSACPAAVDTFDAMLQSRKKLFESSHLPAAYHDYWLADMAFSLSDEAYGVVAPESGRSDLLFFPGCRLAASLPDIVERTYRFIAGLVPSASMLLSCCGIPAEWAGDEALWRETLARLLGEWRGIGSPEVLFACSSCMKAFARRAPEVKARSLYQWLDEHRDALALPRRSGGANACVYDPCNSRADPAARAGVRSLASACGFSLEEIAFSGERAACCGFGGHIYPANPKLVEEIIQIRTEASAAEYIAYCANCRDYFRSSGKESRHILEILFGEEADESGGRRGSGPAGQPEGSPGPESRDFEPPGPGSRDFEPPDPGSSSPESRDPGSPGADKTSLSGLSEQRENRRTLKEKFLGKSASPDKPSPGAAVTVDIPRALREKMNRLLLLDEDVADAIAFCETQDRKIFNKGSGSYIGYHRRRTLTIWVEYEMTDEANAALHNVYTHRMEIRDREQTG